ncbi:MAG: type II toxin-antitoxin system VapB family antitoxin [Myxococcota bacterium]
MRTTLDLDEAAIQAAMATAPGRTRTDLINEALVEFARRRRLARFADLRGAFRWEGDLDELRARGSRRPSARKR